MENTHPVTELFIGSAATVAACSPLVAASRHVSEARGRSIRILVQTARRYRTVQIRACGQLLNAED